MADLRAAYSAATGCAATGCAASGLRRRARIRDSMSPRKWRTRPWIGQADASPWAHIV
jgi:hypothetical protein